MPRPGVTVSRVAVALTLVGLLAGPGTGASAARLRRATRYQASSADIATEGTSVALASKAHSVAGLGSATANGFASPSCTSAPLFAQLSSVARTNCEASGVAVAPVPLSNYGIDTHIASGLDASFADDVDSIVEELVVMPIWTGLVWLIHATVVALEWCYSIDLLAPNIMSDVSGALSTGEQTLSEPWLGLCLAIGGVGLAWHGLVRRRVVETTGQALTMLVMMLIGLGLIADPAGTLGSIAHLADQISVETVSATATGSTTDPVGGLDDALAGVFDSAIAGPWCYLEFGAVDWCRDPSDLDPRLAATARQLERLYAAGATCAGSAHGLVKCVPGGSAEQKSFAATALALTEARTNGALFLALPINALPRGSLSNETALPTLYGALCGSSDADNCTAGTAPQAEFRTEQGTWPRVGGLLLIVLGVAGMVASLAIIAARLLGAAMALLLYLLLAPVAVLAPAFGEGGRNAFRAWLLRLFGASVAKLCYSCVLGVALLVVKVLTTMTTVDWWTQWLLVSVFWWMVFGHRDVLMGYGVRVGPFGRSGYGVPGISQVARVRGLGGVRQAAGRTFGAGVATAREAWQRSATDGARRSRSHGPRMLRGEPGAVTMTGARTPVDGDGPAAHQVVDARLAPALDANVMALRARRERIADEERAATAAGLPRRVASLAYRRQTVDAELAAAAARLSQAGAVPVGARVAGC